MYTSSPMMSPNSFCGCKGATHYDLIAHCTPPTGVPAASLEVSDASIAHQEGPPTIYTFLLRFEKAAIAKQVCDMVQELTVNMEYH